MKSIISFLQEVKTEFLKIIWPPKEEFFRATFVVLLVIFMFVIFLGCINYVFQFSAQKGFQWLVFKRLV